MAGLLESDCGARREVNTKGAKETGDDPIIKGGEAALEDFFNKREVEEATAKGG